MLVCLKSDEVLILLNELSILWMMWRDHWNEIILTNYLKFNI